MNSAAQSILGLLLNPGRLIFGGWEYITTWLWTRRWVALLLIAVPLAVLFFLAAMGAVGRFRSREKMLLSYWEQIELEIQRDSKAQVDPTSAVDSGGESDMSDKATMPAAEMEASSLEALASEQLVSPYLEMLLLRVLELDFSNIRATYWVARNLGFQGRQGQARWMMRRIAGDKTRGFAPAHAWLAIDRLTTLGINSKEERSQLMHDLGIACGWIGSNPQLTLIWAELMAEDGKAAEGLRQLEQVADREPRFWLQVADLAHRSKRREFFEGSATRLRAWMQPRFDDGVATIEDYLASAHLEGLEGDVEAAVTLNSRALQMDPTNPVVRRSLSKAYLAKFKVAKAFSERMDLLDAAMKADGTNPEVTDEIARLLSSGKTDPRLSKALEDKLANGQASAVAHMLIANRKLMDGQYAEAIGHLEIANRMLPSSYIVLNNLALALTRYQPTKTEVLERAEGLANKAIQLRGPDAELYDSLGEIRAAQNDHLGAVECFETSISLDSNRPRTRMRLAASYRAVGLADMARIQERLAQQATAQEQNAASKNEAGGTEDAKASGGGGESATPASGDGSSGK